MHYKKVIKEIVQSGWTKVLVTGPQRSGTRITSKILAHELGFQYIDELIIQNDSLDKLFNLYTNRNNFVLQAPGLAFICHYMPGAVVFSRRNIEDISKSEIRTNWTSEKELKKYFKKEGNISKIKYDIFDQWQKSKSNVFELHYNTLKNHHLYLSKEERQSFKRRQTHK